MQCSSIEFEILLRPAYAWRCHNTAQEIQLRIQYQQNSTHSIKRQVYIVYEQALEYCGHNFNYCVTMCIVMCLPIKSTISCSMAKKTDLDSRTLLAASVWKRYTASDNCKAE